jgi:hypothetical protein
VRFFCAIHRLPSSVDYLPNIAANKTMPKSAKLINAAVINTVGIASSRELNLDDFEGRLRDFSLFTTNKTNRLTLLFLEASDNSPREFSDGGRGLFW